MDWEISKNGNVLDILLLTFPLREWLGVGLDHNANTDHLMGNGICGYVLARFFCLDGVFSNRIDNRVNPGYSRHQQTWASSNIALVGPSLSALLKAGRTGPFWMECSLVLFSLVSAFIGSGAVRHVWCGVADLVFWTTRPPFGIAKMVLQRQ